MTVRDNINAGKYTNQLPFGNNTKLPDWKETRNAYYKEDDRLKSLFKSDLEEENGTQNYSKKDKLFELAWGYGHSSGFNGVLNYYDDLCEIVDLKG